MTAPHAHPVVSHDKASSIKGFFMEPEGSAADSFHAGWNTRLAERVG